MAQQQRIHLPKQEMQEAQVRSLGQEDPLEKERAAHSSIHAWRLQWTEEPGGYSPWGHKESDTTEHTHSLCLKPSSGFYCPCSRAVCPVLGAQTCGICSWPAAPASLYAPLLPLLVLDALVFLALLSSLGPWHELFSPAVCVPLWSLHRRQCASFKSQLKCDFSGRASRVLPNIMATQSFSRPSVFILYKH